MPEREYQQLHLSFKYTERVNINLNTDIHAMYTTDPLFQTEHKLSQQKKHAYKEKFGNILRPA